MLIAIISDIHNNETNLQKVLNYCRSNAIKTIVCCGDLASDETLDFLNDNFSGTIHYAFGNMDNDQLTSIACHPELDSGSKSNRFRIPASPAGGKAGMTNKYKNTFLYEDFGKAEIDGRKIAFVHYPEKAKKLCETGKYDFVFYGHTHKPWTEKIENCIMLNPGNVAGEIYLPTFAVWNTENDKFDLIRIHDLK
ncbi:MAG TPA: YfcE family phosphodiesterase [Candidatus Moranbacteria bacterium]|nr:YfcE family phosphodiesterase [Candidatus Moranbacteria bacterium]